MKNIHFILGFLFLFYGISAVAQEEYNTMMAVETNVGFASFQKMYGAEMGFSYSYQLAPFFDLVAGLNTISISGENKIDDLNEIITPTRNSYSFSPGIRLKMIVSNHIGFDATTMAHLSFWNIYDLRPSSHPGSVCIFKLFVEEQLCLSYQLTSRMSLGMYYGLVYGENDRDREKGSFGHNAGIKMKVCF